MGRTRYHFMLLLCLSFVMCVANGSALGETQTFTGKAFEESGELTYIEQHDVTYDDKKVIQSRTTYFDPEKRVIGYLDSEYTRLPQFCSYTFKDLRKQYEDGVELSGDQICLFRKKDSESEKETVCLPLEEKQIIGQGFHHFIADHLDAIADGEIFHVKLAFPSRLDQFSFRILKKGSVGKNLLIRLEIDNWLLRLFAPDVDVVYEQKSGRLIRYAGISNVADASGQFNRVRIEYEY